MRETDARDRRLLRRERDLGARRAAPARAAVRRSRRRLRLRPARARATPTARTRRASTGATRWRVRGAESRLGSVTGGNGSIYAVRRSDYVEVDPRFGHDLSLPYLMVQRGRRAVYEPEARRVREADADERDRVPPQGAHVRALLADRAAREDAPAARRPATSSQLVSHRHLRYASGLLHLVLLATSIALVAHGWVYDVVLAAQLGLLARGRRRRRDRPLLRARHVGDGRRALELPPPRRAGDVGAGGGHAVNRALDVAIAGAGPRRHVARCSRSRRSR